MPKPRGNKTYLVSDTFLADNNLLGTAELIARKAQKDERKSKEQDDERLVRQQEKRWRVYRKLPEPRPDYFEWAAAYSRRQEYDDTEYIARLSEKMSDRLKAKELLLKYGKTLPKTTVEVSSAAPETVPLNSAQVLDLALKLNGIPPDKFEEFLKTIRA